MRKHPLALCELCPLRSEPFVPSKLVGNSEIFFIGEAPGANEVEQGQPFVGKSGQVLNRQLKRNGIDPETVNKTNAVLCRPRNNMDPPQAAITCCSPRLASELEQAKPSRVVTLGRFAQMALMESVAEDKSDFLQETISDRLEDTGIEVRPCTHPAVIFHEPNFAPTFIQQFHKAVRKKVSHPVQQEQTVIIIENVNHLLEILDGIEVDSPIAVDIETTNLNYYDHYVFNKKEELELVKADTLLCIAFTDRYDQGYIIPVELWDTDLAIRTEFEYFLEFQETIITHNGKFDATWLLYQYGFNLKITFDTMLAQYVLDENMPLGMKELGQYYFDLPEWENDLKQYLPTKQSKWTNIPREKLYKYAIKDVCVTLALGEFLQPKLIEEGLFDWPFNNLMMRANSALIKVEALGIKIDIEYLKKLKVEWTKELETVKLKCGEMAVKLGAKPQSQADIKKAQKGKAWDFNPGSSQQVAYLLYDILKLPTCRLPKLGPRTTDKKWISILEASHPHPFFALMREYRRIQKMITSYCNNLIEKCDLNGRAHTEFKLTGTEIGRLSGDMQQIPRASDKYGEAIRKAIIAEEGNKLIVADASGAELRCMAELSGDSWLIEKLNSGADVHGEMCTLAYGLEPISDEKDPRYQVWKEKRTYAKSTIFSTGYEGDNQTVERMYNQPAGSLRPIYDALLEAWQRYFEWREEQHQVMFKQGFVVSPFNRRRRFVYINEKNRDEAGKASHHAQVSSFASDLNLLALCEAVENGHLVVLTVHDSIYEEAPNELVEQRKKELESYMLKYVQEYVKKVNWRVDIEVK